MKIFLSHASSSEYHTELYLPIKEHFNYTSFNFIFPEELKVNSKDIIKSCDIFFCEISNVSFGVGIETGWADAFNKPIYCFYKEGVKISSAFSYLTDKIFAYKSTDDLLHLLDNILNDV